MARCRRSSWAWTLPISSAQIQRVLILLLEAKRGGELYQAFALLLRRETEQRGIDQARRAIEAEAQVRARRERFQRVIQEVVSVGAELELLLFGDVEVLEKSQIGVE